VRPEGTGRSHFVEALGHHAIDNGKTVAWHTLETLAALLHRHGADDSVGKAISKLIRADVIIIDGVGLLPVSQDAAEALFRVVDGAYERRSIALTSNIHPAGLEITSPLRNGLGALLVTLPTAHPSMRTTVLASASGTFPRGMTWQRAAGGSWTTGPGVPGPGVTGAAVTLRVAVALLFAALGSVRVPWAWAVLA
jgi:hypothetical protein